MNVIKSIKVFKYASIAALLTFSSASFANDVYKWTDDKGQVHFGHNPSSSYDSELLYPKKRSFTQDTDTQSTTAHSVANDESQNEEAENLADEAAPEVFKKDADLCSQAKESKRILIQHPIVRRHGKVLTMEEKNEELKNLDDIISIHC